MRAFQNTITNTIPNPENNSFLLSLAQGNHLQTLVPASPGSGSSNTAVPSGPSTSTLSPVPSLPSTQSPSLAENQVSPSPGTWDNNNNNNGSDCSSPIAHSPISLGSQNSRSTQHSQVDTGPVASESPLGLSPPPAPAAAPAQPEVPREIPAPARAEPDRDQMPLAQPRPIPRPGEQRMEMERRDGVLQAMQQDMNHVLQNLDQWLQFLQAGLNARPHSLLLLALGAGTGLILIFYRGPGWGLNILRLGIQAIPGPLGTALRMVTGVFLDRPRAAAAPMALAARAAPLETWNMVVRGLENFLQIPGHFQNLGLGGGLAWIVVRIIRGPRR